LNCSIERLFLEAQEVNLEMNLKTVTFYLFKLIYKIYIINLLNVKDQIAGFKSKIKLDVPFHSLKKLFTKNKIKDELEGRI
jgi:hypothetical protein